MQCTPERVAKVSAACKYLLRGPLITGREFERLAGHLTFVLLVCRPAISILRHIYIYVPKDNDCGLSVV